MNCRIVDRHVRKVFFLSHINQFRFGRKVRFQVQIVLKLVSPQFVISLIKNRFPSYILFNSIQSVHHGIKVTDIVYALIYQFLLGVNRIILKTDKSRL